MSKAVDILFLTHNRLEYTKATIPALIMHTAWDRVRRFIWYDDDSFDGTRDYQREAVRSIRADVICRNGAFGHPVNVMLDYLNGGCGTVSDIFAKIDNDTLVPACWLSECLSVMDRNPELDLLGIEAFDNVLPGKCLRQYRKAEHIGGIGLMRSRIFAMSKPTPRGSRYGFTEWQHDRGDVVKGWLTPALPVILLDRMPFEPWARLSRQYITNGWQRPWPAYSRRDLIWPWILEKGGIKSESQTA